MAIEVPPLTPRTGCAFLEMARRHGDFGLAGVACTVTLDEAGRCTAARVVLMGVGDGPVVSAGAAAALAGTGLGAGAFQAAAAAARAEVDPPADIHASAAFRRQLVEVLTRRALAAAAERAGRAA
jgi:CO/xanthine dehydrogenase FAD-binding subunit